MTNYTLNHMIDYAPPLAGVVGFTLYYLVSNRVMKLLLLPMIREYREAKRRQRVARRSDRTQVITLPKRRRTA
jgi:hypothetical protein